MYCIGERGRGWTGKKANIEKAKIKVFLRMDGPHRPLGKAVQPSLTPTPGHPAPRHLWEGGGNEV